MSQRLRYTTKWFWCLLILNCCSNWNPVKCVAVRAPSNKPSAIETQAKFFQDFFSVQLSPYKIEFGHVCEDPNTWEQRYEKKDFKNHRDMGKIRWGDKKGGYGEHYWDLNHAGHTGNQGDDDDGSYREQDSGDSYDEPSEQSSNYDTPGYDLENPEQHEDSGREKRAPRRIRTERVQEKEELHESDKPQVMRRPARKQKEQKKIPDADNEEQGNENEEVYRKPVKTQQRRPQAEPYSTEENKPTQQRRPQREQHNPEENEPTKERNQIVLVVDEKEKEETPIRFVPRNPEAKVFVPYENGAGVRQHYQAELTPAASVPRLFLEPSTGHVVDRATGQAYILQPINRNPSYS